MKVRGTTLRRCAVAVLCFLTCGICESFVITPRSWDYRGHHIGFDEARTVNNDSEETGSSSSTLFFMEEWSGDRTGATKEPILLLNGFGVGSFHQHRLMEKLMKENSDDLGDRIVYGVDYLGQGRSWPNDCNDGMSDNEDGLIYSADTWIDQITKFIEEVILPENPQTTRVHVVGNSVGGHLAPYLAVRRPDLVESLCLLNPTPVWGSDLPGWSGHLPAPILPKAIGRYLFDQIRDLDTINRFLAETYANKEAYGEKLVQQIRACTEGNGGHAAFASIMWSPPVTAIQDGSESYYDCLSLVDCDILLVFGKDDPWCKPVFARKMLQSLSNRNPTKSHRYVELTNVGHCPNHEAPRAVAKLVSSWVAAEDRSEEQLDLLKSKEEIVKESWGETTMMETPENEIEVGVMDRLAMAVI